MGINIPSKDELIAANRNNDEIAEKLGADSVKYLSIEGLLRAVNFTKEQMGENEPTGHCTACLTGEYPVPIVEI
jgi:amidophosphoribosyltransferase